MARPQRAWHRTDTPMILEMPKGNRESDGLDWDEINGQTIRSLVRKK